MHGRELSASQAAVVGRDVRQQQYVSADGDRAQHLVIEDGRGECWRGEVGRRARDCAGDRALNAPGTKGS
jgi:hypothetical protein